MERRLLLDIVVRKSTAVLELLAGEDEALLVRWDALLILDLRLHVIDGVAGLDFQRDGLAGEGLDEDLHTSSEAQDEMEGGLLLDVVVRESAAVLELLSGEDKTLLVRWDSLLVLDFGLDIVDGVARLDFEGDGLAGERLYEDLHSTAETEDEMEGALLLDVIIRKGAAILELLARKDETLLIRRNTLLVLDLSLYVVDGIARFDLERDGLSSESLTRHDQ